MQDIVQIVENSSRKLAIASALLYAFTALKRIVLHPPMHGQKCLPAVLPESLRDALTFANCQLAVHGGEAIPEASAALLEIFLGLPQKISEHSQGVAS